jgi:hypothetical protein
MNLNINPNLTATIAADRRRAFALEAEISRTRRNGRLARRAARSAFQAGAQTAVQVATPAVLPLVLQPATIAGPTDGATLLASSDLGHASARVA